MFTSCRIMKCVHFRTVPIWFHHSVNFRSVSLLVSWLYGKPKILCPAVKWRGARYFSERGEGRRVIYLSTSKLSIYVTKNGVIFIYWLVSGLPPSCSEPRGPGTFLHNIHQDIQSRPVKYQEKFAICRRKIHQLTLDLQGCLCSDK